MSAVIAIILAVIAVWVLIKVAALILKILAVVVLIGLLIAAYLWIQKRLDGR